MRWISMGALAVVAACSSGATESQNVASGDRNGSPTVTSFVGGWRSVTPSYEFVRLSVTSKSSVMGELAARLTFSGVAWDGSGRIEGDSLVVTMTMAGPSRASGVLVARLAANGSLRVVARPVGADALDLTVVREE